jgi:hypothetical protein
MPNIHVNRRKAKGKYPKKSIKCNERQVLSKSRVKDKSEPKKVACISTGI